MELDKIHRDVYQFGANVSVSMHHVGSETLFMETALGVVLSPRWLLSIQGKAERKVRMNEKETSVLSLVHK